MQPLDVILISGAFTLAGATLSWWLARRNAREERKAAAGTPGAPTVQEIWVRQDNMERSFKAALVLLEQVAEQEEVDTEQLSKIHLRVLAKHGYLPAEWEHLVSTTE